MISVRSLCVDKGSGDEGQHMLCYIKFNSNEMKQISFTKKV